MGHGPMNPAGPLFMSPPNGIPPFPGLENFMGGPPTSFPGSYPAGPGNPFYGMNPGQFNPGFRFPRGGPGNHRGQMQFGFPGPRGPFMPPMMQRPGGPMILPRGAMMGGRGMGRGAGRGQRGGQRGGRGGGGAYFSGKDSGEDQSSSEKDGGCDEDDHLGNDEVEDFDRGQAEGGESDEGSNSLMTSSATNNKGGGEDGICCDDPPKNAISEQVF